LPALTSPMLPRADRATAYFDRKRRPNDRRGPGAWVALVRSGDTIVITEFETEAQARSYIGLEGGSQDPAYRPPAGSTGHETRTFER
jgi:hypothetical protein